MASHWIAEEDDANPNEWVPLTRYLYTSKIQLTLALDHTPARARKRRLNPSHDYGIVDRSLYRNMAAFEMSDRFKGNLTNHATLAALTADCRLPVTGGGPKAPRSTMGA